jgi:hypothetical protein
VFLEGVPVGEWRLSTKGFYAPAEIRGLQDIMRACEVADMLVRAQMRLEWRTDKKMEDGQPSTLIYPVVVIEPRQSADELLAIGEERRQRQLHPATEHKQLAEHIADLYGDPAQQPAGEEGAEYIIEIENAILDQKGNIAQWFTWAEKSYFKKARALFTVADWQEFLAKVRQAAVDRAARAAQKAQDAGQTAAGPSAEEDAPRTSQDRPGAPDVQDASTDVSAEKVPLGAPASPEGSSGEPESPQLFLQDKRAEDYGNG